MGARTEKFQSSFYPNCISEWNKLDPEIRNVPSIAIFKSKLLSIIHPPAKSVFGIHDPIGISVVVRPFFQLNILSNHDLMNLLLYGDEDLPSDVNKRVIEYTLNFIHETGRFN